MDGPARVRTSPAEPEDGLPIEIKQLDPKDLIGVVTVLASTCALSYDVGFFFGLDIELFTLFTLAEHLLSSLQILPVTFALATGFIFFVDQITAERMLEDELIRAGKARRVHRTVTPARNRIIAVAGALAMAAIAYFLLDKEKYFQLAAAAIGIITILFQSFGGAFHQKVVWIPYSILCLTVLSFAVGFDEGASIAVTDKVTHSVYSDKEPACFPARIVRSGQAGLLFVHQPSRQLTFLKWDNVKRIAAVSTPQQEQCPTAGPAPGSSGKD